MFMIKDKLGDSLFFNLSDGYLIIMSVIYFHLMMMSVKNHQMAPTIRVDAAFGFRPEPWRLFIESAQRQEQI